MEDHTDGRRREESLRPRSGGPSFRGGPQRVGSLHGPGQPASLRHRRSGARRHRRSGLVGAQRPLSGVIDEEGKTAAERDLSAAALFRPRCSGRLVIQL